jgi:hypothetical protein
MDVSNEQEQTKSDEDALKGNGSLFCNGRPTEAFQSSEDDLDS